MVAGIFYPDDPYALSERVGASLRAAMEKGTSVDGGQALAILSPHAAFEYTCNVQAAAWASAACRRIERVVMVAPVRNRNEAGVYLPESAVYQTPLGDVEVDTGACADLESCSTLFTTNDIPHFESHAIEVQLPFMRSLFPEAQLVPVLVSGDVSLSSSLARAIDVVFGDDSDRTLFVASSNLASSIVASDAATRSGDIVRLMESGSWRELADRRDIAGSAAIAAIMAIQAMVGARFSLLVRVDSRNHNTTMSEETVHYAGAAWHAGGSI